MRLLNLYLLLFYTVQVWAATEPDIEINGLDEALENNVRAHLSLLNENCQTPHWEIEGLLKKSPQQIKSALRALGYYTPSIQYELSWRDDCWQLQFSIDSGAPVRLDNIDIKLSGAGAGQTVFQELLADSSLQSGDILNHGTYEQFKSSLVRMAEAHGFFAYQLNKSVLQVYPEQNKADIIIDFDTGYQFFIGRIEIIQDILDPAFVEKYLEIKAGQAYDRRNIVKTHQTLQGSGYFQHIQIKYQQQQAENYIAPVTIELQPNPRHVLSFGAGYDTDLGIRGNAEYSNRYINRQGHRLEFNASAAQRKSYVYLNYHIPLSSPRKDKLTFTGGFFYEDTASTLSETYLIGARWSQQIYEDMLLMQQLNYIGENYNAGNGQRRFSLLLVPRVTFSNIKTDKKELYVDGYKYSLQLRGATRYVLSDVNFIQAQAFFKYSLSFDWGGRIISRADFGTTAVDDFIDLPTSFRYYAGGENSIRAYKYKSLGPLDDRGEVLGGQHLAVASLEYEQKIVQQWSLATFVDAGNAFTNDFDIKVGIGFGFRWYSLVGPIRVDMAFPTEDLGDFRFNFSFSTAL